MKPSKISGTSISYNHVDDIWKFHLKNLEIKDDHFKQDSDSCLLVSLDGNKNPIEPVPEDSKQKGKKKNMKGKKVRWFHLYKRVFISN